MKEKLKGLVAAPFTPFNADGRVNYDMIPKQAELLIRQGVSGAYISGTTGEGISCTTAERIEVMDAWKDAAAGRLKLIVHTGALALGDIRELGHHAEKIGVFATSIVPPTYFKPQRIQDLVDFCREAASAAPNLPFYYYHTMLTAPNPPMREFLKAANGVIPNLAGIKFNCHNLYDYQNCMHLFDGKYDIVYGVDEFFAGALALGAEGFIGSTYNYSAQLYFRMWENFKRGDMASVRKDMMTVCKGVDLLVKYGGVAAGKALMRIHGLDCGDVRPPLAALSAAVKEEIKAAGTILFQNRIYP